MTYTLRCPSAFVGVVAGVVVLGVPDSIIGNFRLISPNEFTFIIADIATIVDGFGTHITGHKVPLLAHVDGFHLHVSGI